MLNFAVLIWYFKFIISLFKENMSLIFTDTETTGLDPVDGCEITEIGCIVIKDNMTVDSKNYFHKRFLIQDKSKANPEALEVGHYSDSIWEKTAVHPEIGLKEWNDWLKKVSSDGKPILIAQNAEFDKSFILSECDKYMVFPYIHNTWIDLISLWLAYKIKKKLTHLGDSLGVICKHFGVENSKAHAALSDSIASAQCFCKLMNITEYSNEYV
jgi:DNA polymerase III alpha subunit (gram-positive type)